MPVGVFAKIKCEFCGKKIDPRGRTAHERSHDGSMTRKAKTLRKVQSSNGALSSTSHREETELTLIVSASGALLLDEGVLRPIKKIVRL